MFRSTIMLAAGSALSLGFISPAQAQTPSGPIEEGTPRDAALDTIIVTGFRASEREAIETKRATFNIVDVVSADDIGRLPDQNTAAALRRIPGISVQEDQGEPRFPVIRGLPSTYNRTQINGGIVASVSNSDRTVPLDIVPSTLASRLEVFKTVTPDLDPNAIAGIINIVTQSAFDANGPFLQATGALTAYEQSGDIRGEKLSWRANATAGATFGADDQFGIVASASYQIRDSDIPQVETANPSYREYTAAGTPVNLGAAAGNDILVPVQRRLFLYNNIRERTGGALTLEWQAADTLYMRLFGTYNRMEDDEVRHENRIEQVGNVIDQTPTTGTFISARNIVGLGRFQINRSIWNAQYNLRYEPSDAVTAEFDALYSGAELDNPESTEDFRTSATAPFGFAYDFSDFFHSFNPLNPAATADPANYRFNSRGELQRTSTEDVYEARAALTWRTQFARTDLALKAGGLYRETDRVNDQDFTSFSLPATSPLSYTLADAFERRPVDIVGGYTFDLIVNSAGANDFFAANRDAFTGNSSNVTSDFTVNERIYGGFAQGSAELMDLQVIAGVRFERTDVASTATRTLAGVNTPADREGSYDSWLPSVHLRWNAGDDLVVRAAYTTTIGRPDFSDITARESISLSANAVPTLSRGNPGLRPRRSNGIDASIEYYTPGGLLALGMFFKDIKDEIFNLTTIEMLDLGIGRGVEQVQVSQARNAQSALLFGIEAAIQQTFTFLPAPFDGFGVNLNATWVHSDLKVVTPVGPRERGFVLQPEWIANAQLFYEQGPFQARVAYNYIGEFLENINGNIPAADQFWKERGQLDAQVRLRLTPQIELFAEGENLTDAGRRELTGPGRNLLQEAAQYGRTFSVGASVAL